MENKESQTAKVIARWREDFKDHVATHEAGNGIRWAKPGTGGYDVSYLLDGKYLFVVGDIGAATYQWKMQVRINWLGSISLDRLALKCVASPVGVPFEQWDPETARLGILAQWDDWDEADKGIPLVEAQTAFAGLGGNRARWSQPQWQEWVDIYAVPVFGCDCYKWVYKVGLRIADGCIGHWVGLQMAVDQLARAAKEGGK